MLFDFLQGPGILVANWIHKGHIRKECKRILGPEYGAFKDKSAMIKKTKYSYTLDFLDTFKTLDHKKPGHLVLLGLPVRVVRTVVPHGAFYSLSKVDALDELISGYCENKDKPRYECLDPDWISPTNITIHTKVILHERCDAYSLVVGEWVPSFWTTQKTGPEQVYEKVKHDYVLRVLDAYCVRRYKATEEGGIRQESILHLDSRAGDETARTPWSHQSVL